MKRFFYSIIRNIKRNPFYSAINIFGLVLGFLSVFLISAWIKYELSYDSFHTNSKNIYRVHRYFYDPDGAENLHLQYVAPTIAPLLKNEIPEIQHIARVSHTGLVFRAGDKKILENNTCFAEPEILNIFDFKGLPNNENLLKQPLTLIISEKAAQRFFQTANAVGKSLDVKDDSGKKYSFVVQGVFQNWGQNSHFKPEVYISFSTYESIVGQEELKNWGSNNYETFALIPHMPKNINSKLDGFINKQFENGTEWTKIRLESLTDIHFNWYSSRSFIYILASVALLILIVGSINYMNLNVAMYTKRLKEIKVKKVVGASKKHLTLQLISESVFFCFSSVLIALGVISLFASSIDEIIGNGFHLSMIENTDLIAGVVILSVVTGVLSVLYPVLIVSSFKPVISGGKEKIAAGNNAFRGGLVTFQFTVSIALVISFLFVFKQTNYLHEKNLGLDKENIVVIPSTQQLNEKLDVLKQQLAQNPNIISASASKRTPSQGLWDSGSATVISDGSSKPLDFRLANINIDESFLSTYKIELAAGKNFEKFSESNAGYLINETAAKKIGWDSPEDAIGNQINYSGQVGRIIGVTKDFHYESLHIQLAPVIMMCRPENFNSLSIRITPFDKTKTLAFIENVWQQYNLQDNIFSYEFMDDRFNRLYTAEENIKQLLNYFMIIALSIAILGLIGLSMFIIQRRVKEIGIRKVNGAKISEVMTLLNKDFIRWVAIAFLIATPIAWYGMHSWMQSFAYKTTLSWWIFALAGVLALGIALLTVSWQSWRAATRNPVEALRYE
ncbi:putative ABC transport system permease protein [Mariniphaga anaerophila]|uniref:Putative ABC transport system permease protein n=1 Tax=Mariniphaga anaerophila TaxID=1484053 RepID=A0A1M5FPW5_9BACT|nr:ABC transporter permease [Mariniphaga anaerophila]SHF93232.1 putative ABC transport system permease protein [Mariniphaga anaerophila]